MSWTILFSAFFGDVKKHRFSQRRVFFDELTKRVHQRAGIAVAWPDALMFIEPNDWTEAAKVAGFELNDDAL